jgi:hypothetical protein
VRAAARRGGHVSTDIFTAVILSRTSLDAYLHELLSLRLLSPYVEFATGSGAGNSPTQEIHGKSFEARESHI